MTIPKRDERTPVNVGGARVVLATIVEPTIEALRGCCVDKACGGDTCMTLPPGVTCGSCLWVARCLALGVTTRDGRSCDFFPRRYMRDLEPTPPPKGVK